MSHPYDKWILDQEPAANIILFNQDDSIAHQYLHDHKSEYSYITFFDDWKHNRCIDLEIVKSDFESQIDSIAALSECDLVRAGELRDFLKIGGISLDEVNFFRNKHLMKSAAKETGLLTPRFALITNVFELIDFAKLNGFPFIIKPIDSAGAVGIDVIKDKKDFDEWVRLKEQIRDEPIQFIVEEYISAPIIVVDGLMMSGNIIVSTVSSYQGSCLDRAKKQVALGLLQEKYESELYQKAQKYAKQLISAMPHINSYNSFHMELLSPAVLLLLSPLASYITGSGVDVAGGLNG